ncbi:MAG: hypothetical protein H6R05_1357 [Burkholderiaceae bacterium]|nr:hypothetical protein [Burkholderiaceae bacterium]
MPRQRTDYEKAVGQLISAIQKEWTKHAGEGDIEKQSEAVMYRAHHFYKTETQADFEQLLQGGDIERYLGSDWVKKHPQIRQYFKHVENSVTPNPALKQDAPSARLLATRWAS